MNRFKLGCGVRGAPVGLLGHRLPIRLGIEFFKVFNNFHHGAGNPEGVQHKGKGILR